MHISSPESAVDCDLLTAGSTGTCYDLNELLQSREHKTYFSCMFVEALIKANRVSVQIVQKIFRK